MFQHGNLGINMTLYKPTLYPAPLRRQIEQMSLTAMEIANRWALGWPNRVKELIKTGEYLEALQIQEQKEIQVKLDPWGNHLSSWEKAEVFGLTMAPPATETEDEDEDEEMDEAEQNLKEIRQLMAETQQAIQAARTATSYEEFQELTEGNSLLK